MKAAPLSSGLALLLSFLPLSASAMTPDFGPNVLIFDPSSPGLQARIDALYAQQVRSQFGPGRYALLFKPG